MADVRKSKTDAEALREDAPLAILIDTGTVVERAIERRLLPTGLSASQQRLLAFLYFSTEPLTPSMLAALMLQEAHSISGLLNRLEDEGAMITRTRDKKDRRVVWVGLSAVGRKVAEEGIRIAAETMRELQQGLNEVQTHAIGDLAATVRDKGIQLVGVKERIRREALRRV